MSVIIHLFDITCNNKGSYAICAAGRDGLRTIYGRPVVLIRCDREDPEDNQRGLALAQIVCDRLNQLTLEEAKALLDNEQEPANFGDTLGRLRQDRRRATKE